APRSSESSADTKVGALPEVTIKTQMPTRRDTPARKAEKKPAPAAAGGEPLGVKPPRTTVPYGKAVTRQLPAMNFSTSTPAPPPAEEPVLLTEDEVEAPTGVNPVVDPEEIVIDDDEPL
ncbi:MAG TPA: hypothetical protein VFD06_10345, partial [Candidatus Polarisedimenticolia bacterium]|nr:hypothetical protein [Candidatus Polarisedimenticolia bacterium]